MSTVATIKVEDRTTGDVRRIRVLHDGFPTVITPILVEASEALFDVDEVMDEIDDLLAARIYRGKVPTNCIARLRDSEESTDTYADFRYRVLVGGRKAAEIISSADLV